MPTTVAYFCTGSAQADDTSPVVSADTGSAALRCADADGEFIRGVMTATGFEWSPAGTWYRIAG